MKLFPGALRLAIFVGITTSVTSCSLQEQVSKTKGILVDSLVDSLGKYPENSPTTISGATVEGNKLTLQISFSGNVRRHLKGVAQHVFTLLGSRGVLESTPGQRRIVLHHHNNGDFREGLVRDEITFDISDFADGNGAEIYLILDGYKDRISYTRK